MRVMNGRLSNIVRSPLMRNSYLNGNNQVPSQHTPTGKRRRCASDADDSFRLPRPVIFDESSDSYRCLCGCFHVKIGAYCIAGVEVFLIFVYFLNALLILLQQQNDLDKAGNTWNSSYVQIAFIVESISLGIALSSVLLMLVGLERNSDKLLIPHLFIQSISIVCFILLLMAGAIALWTDHAFFYRIINAAPFNEYPGQSTVALSAETAVRMYSFIFLYFLTLVLECWFIRIIYNCNRYFNERRTYMDYCMAYSTPMKTLNSAR